MEQRALEQLVLGRPVLFQGRVTFLTDPKKGDILFFPGLDTGSPMVIKEKRGNLYLVHTSGFTGWAGIGLTSYYPAQYSVVRITKRPFRSKPEEMMNWGEILIDFDSGRNWRQVKKQALDWIDRENEQTKKSG